MAMENKDVLNVLNENINTANENNYNDINNELGVFETNTQNLKFDNAPKNKFGIGLNESEMNAREQGVVDYRAGVNHVGQDEIRFNQFKKSAAGGSEPADEEETLVNENSIDTESVNVSELYKDTLGRTEYAELKRRCGLAEDDSFTDYYNRTHHVPKGFELDARLALAEEKRMRLFTEYESGKMSEANFLYEAYGKDLLKEQGIDLSSKLYWYNKIKSGDSSNPLDSDTFLAKLIDDSRTIFENEKWFKEINSKTLGESLAGVVTGQELSTSKVKELFGEQINALSEYFNDDTNKVITYYKAGTLGSAFNPFIDIDDDGKYDYYYHTDGKMYAVEDSSGIGNSKVEVEYNDDGSVHAVDFGEEIGAGFLEGFRDFWVGFADIFVLAGNAIQSIWTSSEGMSFADHMQNWEAIKNSSVLLGSDYRVTLDGNKNAEDYAYEISKGIGTVAGIVVLTLVTMGIGTATNGVTQGTKAGATIASNAAKNVGKNATTATVKTVVQNSIKEFSEEILKQTGKNASKNALKAFTKELYKELGKSVGKKVAKEAIETAGLEIGKVAIKNGIVKGLNYISRGVTGARNGTFFGGGNVVTGKLVPVIWGSVTDSINTFASLEAQNRVLKYYENEMPDSGIKALDNGEILGRAIGVGAINAALSSALRLQGDYGLTTWKKNSSKMVSKVLNGSTEVTIEHANKLISKMAKFAVIDNIADAAENLLTAGVSAAFNNPYAKIGSEESWESFRNAMVSPQVLISTLYQTVQNVKSFGSWSKSTFDSRMEELVRSYQINPIRVVDAYDKIIYRIGNDKTVSMAEADSRIKRIRTVKTQFENKLKDNKGSYLDNAMEITRMSDQIFSADTDLKDIEFYFNVDSKTAKKLKDTVEYLNKTKGANDPEYGYATALIYNDANVKNNDNIKTQLELVYKVANAKSDEVKSVWLRMANGFRFNLDKEVTGNIFNATRKIYEMQNKNLSEGLKNLTEDKYVNLFLSERFKLVNPVLENNKEKINELLEGKNALFTTHYFGEMSAFESTNDIYNEFQKAAAGDKNASELIKELVDKGVILTKEVNGKTEPDISAPIIGIEAKREKRNDVLQNELAKDLLMAYDYISYVSTKNDLTGDTIFDFNTPLMQKVSFKDGTPDNPNSERTIYFITIDPDKKTIKEIIDRVHAVHLLSLDYATLLNCRNNNLSKETIEDIMIRMSKLSGENCLDPLAELKSLEADLKDENKRKEIIKNGAITDVIKSLFSDMKFFAEDNETEANKKKREQVLYFWSKGIITDEILTEIATGSNKNKITPEAQEIAKEVQLYIDVYKKIFDITNKIYNTDISDGQIIKELSLSDKRKLKEIILTLNEQGNEKLRKTLDIDNRLPKLLKEIVDNPGKFESFFVGFAENGREQTQESISAIVNRRNEDSDILKQKLADYYDIQFEGVMRVRKEYSETIVKNVREKINDNFKSLKTIKLKRKLTDEDYIKIFVNPEEFAKSLTMDDFIVKKHRASKKYNVDETRIEFETFVNNLKLFVAVDKSLIFGLPTKELYNAVINNDESAKDLISIIKFANKDLVTELDIQKFSYDENTGVLSYDGKNILDYIIEVNDKSKIIYDDFKKTSIEKIMESVEAHEKLMYQDTKVQRAKNTVEINLLDLHPSELNKFFNLYSKQKEAQENYSQTGKIQQADLERKLHSFFNSGSLSFQQRELKKIISKALANNTFILEFDLDNSSHVKTIKKILHQLGYDSDIHRLKNHEASVPGIMFKTKTTMNVSTNLDYKEFVASLQELVKIVPIVGDEQFKASFKNYLKNIFSNVFAFNDDTEVKIKTEDGNAIKLFGSVKDTNSELELNEGNVYSLSTEKRGVLAGELSKTLQWVFDAVSFSGDVDQKSLDTYNVLRVINELDQYKDKEYMAQTIVVTSKDKKVKDFYNRKDNSVYLYTLEQVNGNEYVFKLNPNFDKQKLLEVISKNGFNIRYLIPVWDFTESKKTYDFKSMQDISFETPFTIIKDIPGFGTLEEMKAATKGITVYDLNDAEYNKIFSKDSYTVKELKDIIESNKNTMQNNYWFLMLKHYIDLGEKSNGLINNIDNSNSIKKFVANNNVLTVAGEMLDNSKYEHGLVVDKSVRNATLVKQFVEELNNKISAANINLDYNYNTSINYSTETVTTSDLLKLNLRNAIEPISEEDVNVLFDLIYSSKDNLIFKTGGDVELIQHNALVTSLSNFVESDENGKLTISVDFYKNTSVNDRIEFIDALAKLIERTKDEDKVAELAKLISVLENKNELITELDGDFDLLADFKNAPTQIGRESVASNVPSFIVKASQYLSQSKMPQAEKELILKLIQNKNYAVTPNKLLIKSSSLDINSKDIDPLTKWYANMVDSTLYRTVNKEGSTMIYNFNVKEAIAEFFESQLSFYAAIQEINNETGILSGIKPEHIDGLIFELGQKANLYSSGIAFESEFAGALVVKYNSNANNGETPYEIVPIITSSTEGENDILFSLLKENYKDNKHDKYLLLTTSKNSFKYNISGFDGTTNIYDLNNKQEMAKIYQYAFEKAYDNTKLNKATLSAEEIIIDYYKPKISKFTLKQNLVQTAKNFGISTATAETLYANINSINVRNQASLTETEVNMYLNKFLDEAEKREGISVEFNNFKDAVLFGVNLSSISDNAMLQLEIARDTIRANNKVAELGDIIKDKGDNAYIKKTLDTFSTEEKVELVKYLMLTRLEGKDLSAIFNLLDKHSLKEYFEKMYIDDDTPELNKIFNSRTFAIYDTEWLYSESDSNTRELYEIGFDIYTKDSEKPVKYTIIIKDNINIKDLKHEESDDSFSTKVNYANGKIQLPPNILVVKDIIEAYKVLANTTSDVDLLVGYNNKGKDSDNSFFKNVGDPRLQKLIDNSVDFRNEILTKYYSNIISESGKELALTSREALDVFRERGIIKTDDTTTAHSAASDNEDLFKLIVGFKENKANTEKLYKGLEVELKELLGDSYDEVASKVSFSEINFNKKYDSELIDSINVFGKNTFKKGNTVLKQMLDSYNIILEQQNSEALTKIYNRSFGKFNEYDEDFETYTKAISNEMHKKFLQEVVLTIAKKTNGEKLDKEAVEKNYTTILKQISFAAKKYKEDYKEKHPLYTNAEISTDRILERFLSLPEKEIIKYLASVDSDLGDKLSKKDYLSPADKAVYNSLDWQSMFMTAGIITETQRGTSSKASHTAYKINKSIIEPLEGSIQEYVDSDLTPYIINDLITAYGIKRTEENDIKNRKEKIQMTNKIDDKVFEEIYGIVNDELYSEIAAYQMLKEEVQYKTVSNQQIAENGTIYINKKMWKEMYPDSDRGDVFYTKVWRQPGEQKTVMHIMKVVLTDEPGFFMNRDTAKSYFNGDFDGDFYYISKPKDTDQSFGEKLWSMNNAAANVLNIFANNMVFKDSSRTKEHMQDAIFSFGLKVFENPAIINALKLAVLDSDKMNSVNLKEKVDWFNNVLTILVQRHLNETLSDNEKVNIGEYTKLFVDTLGLKFVPESTFGGAYVRTGNFFIKENRDLIDVYNKLEQNNLKYKQQNLIQTDIDSSTIGVIAKKLYGEEQTGKPSELLFNSTLTMTDESLNYLDSLISATNDTETIKANLMNALSEIEKELSTSMSNVKKYLGSIKKDELSAKEILFIAQLAQHYIQNSDTYNKATISVLQETLPEETSKFRNKVSLVQDFAFNNGYIKTKEDLSSLQSPQLAMILSDHLNKILGIKRLSSARFDNRSNLGIRNLLMSILVKGDAIVNTRNRTELISSSPFAKVNEDGSSIGLGNMIVGVCMDDSLTDSAYVVDAKKYNHNIKEQYITDTVEFKLNLSSDNEIEYLIKNVSKELTGKEINKLLHLPKDRSPFNNNEKYILDGIVNPLTGTPNEITDKSVAVFRHRDSLYDAASKNVLKFGMLKTKSLKVTVGPGAELDTFDKSFVPNLLVSKNAFLKEPHIDNRIKDLGKQVTTKDGKTYKLYSIEDLTLLNVSDINKININNREFDIVSIVQGAHGADAVFNIGNFFYSINENGELTYDPSGFKAIRQALIDSNKPLYQNVNGARQIQFLRIAVMFKYVKDKNTRNEIIDYVCKQLKIQDKENFFEELYCRPEIGGSIGMDIENAIIRRMSEEDFKKLKNDVVSGKTALIKTVFSDDVTGSLNPKLLTSAEDIGDLTYRKRNNTAIGKMTNTGYQVINDQKFVAEYENGNVDLNEGRFIPRAAFAQELIENYKEDSVAVKSLLQSGTKEGYLRTAYVVDGNRNNNYNSITEGENYSVNMAKHTNVFQKSGAAGQVQNKNIILDGGNMYGLIRPTKLDSSSINVTSETYNKIKKISKYDDDQIGLYGAQKILAPAFLNGTAADIYDAQNDFKKNVDIRIAKPLAKISNDEKDLEIGLDWNIKEDLAPQEVMSEIKNISSSPKKARLFEQAEGLKENEITKDMVDSYKKSTKDDKQLVEELNVLAKQIDDNYENAMGNLAIKSVPLLDTFMNKEELQSCMKELISISCDDNETELRNAYLNSTGMKSNNDYGIGLGEQVLYKSRIVESEMNKLLGDEFALILHVLKNNKSKVKEFNDAMTTEKNLNSYDSLVSHKKMYIAKLGEAKYNSELAILTNKITENGKYTIEEAKSKHLSAIRKGDTVSILIEYAQRINARILEEARKRNPYTICGWFMPSNINSNHNKKKVYSSYINAHNVYVEDISKVINGEFTSGNLSELRTSLIDESKGYLGSIINATRQLSEETALTRITNFAKEKGFMRNVELYSASQAIVNKYIDDFINSFSSLNPKRLEESERMNKETYNRLLYIAQEIGITNGSLEDYEGPESLVKFLNFVSNKNRELNKLNNVYSQADIEAKLREAQINNKAGLEQSIKCNELYQSTLAIMMNIICENKGTDIDNILLEVYEAGTNLLKKNGDFVLVDDRGAKLEIQDSKKGRFVPTYKFENPIDGMIREIKYGNHLSEKDRKLSIARMMLQGDVYLMRRSVADQLEDKVFVTRVNSQVQNILRKSKSIISTGIMSTPTSAINNWINFPQYDIGVVLSSDIAAAKYLKPALAALTKLSMMKDTITEEAIMADKNLQYAIRFLHATNQNLFDTTSIRGEKVVGLNIPVLKEYLKTSNFMYNIGNLFPRFAYWMDLVVSGENDANYKINSTKTGVAYHLMDGINTIEGYEKSDIYKNEDGTYNKQLANLDAQAAAIVAEHNGLENAMPYLAGQLSSRFGLMFLAFPLQAVRWGKNRLQSLMYAVSTINTSESRAYLFRNLGSTALQYMLLLTLQILLSEDTREYLGIYGQDKKEEQSEEEKQNAINILFRGGCVKLFDTIIKGEETTTPHHSRGPISGLFDSYIADFIPQYNQNYNEEGFFKTLIDKLVEKTWGHANFAIKDVVESIPGNNILQSSWVEPGDNFWENYGRKVLGYTMGYNQANNFADYMKASGETDEHLLNRIRDGMTYAYSKNYANTKEHKAEYRNYKKAFNIVYEYKQLTKTTTADPMNLTVDSSAYPEIKEDFKLAIKTMSSPSAIYDIIIKYKQNGVSLQTIRAALRTCSLKYQINNLADPNSFYQSLSTAERANIISAIEYEDYNYNFLDDILEELDAEYQSLKHDEYKTYQANQVANSLRQRYYNTPRVYNNYNYNNKYRSYNYGIDFVRNFINNNNYKNRYSNLKNPFETYQQMENTKRYGTSFDIWGNRYTRYTNKDGDKWTYDVNKDK